MPKNLPILEQLEGEEELDEMLKITGKPQRGTFKFTVQDDSEVYLNCDTNEWCLLKDGHLYPLWTIMRGPSLPSREIMDNCALSGLDLAVKYPERMWDYFCNVKRAQLLRTAATMLMVNQPTDEDYE